ncbi:MAG: gliding motility protein GldL [Bacteroidetes bacterium]|nr:gliding motility protein GldL [Bacteroidota bacterium]MBV6460483.1 hypothetical protein [Flavobacteriales bacterium]WKZ74231.1 MAG: gliding motility protein GldL [Vicingaceae bacterium]MCL4815897.1 gliding motility protein GldL [Flavobacteriales bacterium]NOG94756.1 gliding motility protein GldL [Bacteroidota bacterium]
MGFVEFLFHTKKGKTVMGLLYGLGASIVIVGALFKIQHWPGAGIMLTVGLLTEALIFAVSAFEPPHMDIDWTLVYPELAGMHDEDGGDGHGGKKKTVTEELDNMLEQAKIGPELIESLGNGLRNLSENAGKLTNITDASVATNEYASSLRGAASKVGELSDTYAAASESLTGLKNSNEAGAAAGEHLQAMSKNLSALNAIYELQLQGANEHMKSTSNLYAGISDLLQNLNSSVEDTKKYKSEIAELSKNLSALNTVYGNMLSAMNINKG